MQPRRPQESRGTCTSICVASGGDDVTRSMPVESEPRRRVTTTSYDPGPFPELPVPDPAAMTTRPSGRTSIVRCGTISLAPRSRMSFPSPLNDVSGVPVRPGTARAPTSRAPGAPVIPPIKSRAIWTVRRRLPARVGRAEVGRRPGRRSRTSNRRLPPSVNRTAAKSPGAAGVETATRTRPSLCTAIAVTPSKPVALGDLNFALPSPSKVESNSPSAVSHATPMSDSVRAAVVHVAAHD